MVSSKRQNRSFALSVPPTVNGSITGQGGNTAVWVRGDGVLLVDTKLENNGQAILDQVRKVTDKPMACAVHSNVGLMHATMSIFEVRVRTVSLGLTPTMASVCSPV